MERNKNYAKELNKMIAGQFADLSDRITVFNTECNSKLQDICESTNWHNNRALLFLDPYSTEVRWETLKAIAKTKAIDVWYLFPLSAANRLMKNDREIDPLWKAKLDKIFGDSGWYEKFYIEDPQTSLFCTEEKYIKDVNTEELKKYICERLKTIFPGV